MYSIKHYSSVGLILLQNVCLRWFQQGYKTSNLYVLSNYPRHKQLLASSKEHNKRLFESPQRRENGIVSWKLCRRNRISALNCHRSASTLGTWDDVLRDGSVISRHIACVLKLGILNYLLYIEKITQKNTYKKICTYKGEHNPKSFLSVGNKDKRFEHIASAKIKKNFL